LKSGDNTHNYGAARRQSSSKALLGVEHQSHRRNHNHVQNHSPHKSASFAKEHGTAMMNSDSAKQIGPSHTPASSSFTVHAQVEKNVITS